MHYDFFISYSHKDFDRVKAIVDNLESSGAKCWFAPRDVVGRYAKAIVDAIGDSHIFLLCLSKNSAVSEHVLNEVEMAYNKRRSSNNSLEIEPLCLEDMDIDSPELDEIMYYIRRINFISPANLTSAPDIAREVIMRNKDLLQLSKNVNRERTASLYYTSERENKRLQLQNVLLRRFDGEVYREVFGKYPHPDILDVGCGNCDMILDRLNGTENFRLVGLERDPNKIEEAKAKHPDANALYIAGNVEEAEVWEKLNDLMEREQIDKFDIINVSMLLLHLKNSCALLRKLRRLLKPAGCVVIKDIDDGLNFAYPDDDGSFERVYRICDNNETSGERHNGRQIYTNLYRAGFRNIQLKKSGFNTIGMSFEEKEAFFGIYFKFILGDIQWMHNKYPANLTITDDCEWYTSHYDEMLDNFLKDDFIFSLGFQMYIAKNQEGDGDK